MNEADISHDGESLFLQYGNGVRLTGMYGAGIAFPEKWIDPSGILDSRIA